MGRTERAKGHISWSLCSCLAGANICGILSAPWHGRCWMGICETHYVKPRNWQRRNGYVVQFQEHLSHLACRTPPR